MIKGYNQVISVAQLNEQSLHVNVVIIIINNQILCTMNFELTDYKMYLYTCIFLSDLVLLNFSFVN